jgi:hypothetical protein
MIASMSSNVQKYLPNRYIRGRRPGVCYRDNAVSNAIPVRQGAGFPRLELIFDPLSKGSRLRTG